MNIKKKLGLFVAVLIGTVFITRVLTYYTDLDLFIFGYELHHFYYGVVLLLLLNITLLFGGAHPKVYTVLSAFAIGLVSDEFLFIMGGFRNNEYPSTLTHSIFITLSILTLLAIVFLEAHPRYFKTKS